MKRKTKAQREQQQYDALYRRVCDILTGATGCRMQDDFMLSLPDLWRVVNAVEIQLLAVNGEVPEGRKFMSRTACMEYYEGAKKLTDFLFSYNIRT